MKTYIIHGPAGCGKTTNAEQLAEKLTGNPNQYVDNFDFERTNPKSGHVHFGWDLGRMKENILKPGENGKFVNTKELEILSFDQAMERLREPEAQS